MAKRAILHPVALTVLCVSLALAVAVATLPQLYPWRERLGWLLVWGFLAYLGTVAAAGLLPAATPPPREELKDLYRIRDHIAGRLRRMSNDGVRRRELESVLQDALRQIDEEITPDMRKLLDRQVDLTDYLDRINRGTLPLPDKPYLDRVNAIRERQVSTIRACVQAGANALATLVAILQEGNEAATSERARAWADDLDILHDAIVEVIHDEDEASQPEAGEELQPEPDIEPRRREAIATEWGDTPAPALVSKLDSLLVVTALRSFNNAALLAESELGRYLPCLMIQALHQHGRNGTSVDPSPIERAQALRKVLRDGVERLKPLDDNAIDSASLQYRILRDEYIEGHPTKWLEARFGISESTLHRYRKAALGVLARDLLKQEERLADDRVEEEAALRLQ